MSFVTNFNFTAFASDLRARETLTDKNSFSLSLLTSEEMARMSAVDITCRLNDKDLLRATPWAPKTLKRYPGLEWPTFWDTRMGNFDQRGFATQRCSTCQTDDVSKFGNERCTGHFGTIRMPRYHPMDAARDAERVVVYNPHLFAELTTLMQAQCFFCHRFRANPFDVARFRWALVLVDAGFVGEALNLLETIPASKSQEARTKRQREANERVVNDCATLELHVKSLLAQHGVTEADLLAGRAVCRSPSGLSKLATLDVRHDIVKDCLKELRDAPNECSCCHTFSPRVTVKDSHLFFHFGKRSFIDCNLQSGKLRATELQRWERENRLHNRSRTYLSSNMALSHLKVLCETETTLLALLFPHIGEASAVLKRNTRLPTERIHEVFFLDRLLVPPLPLRLNSGVQVQDSGAISPDSKTKALDTALGFVEQIEAYFNIVNSEHKTPSEAQEVANEINLRNLQLTVNEYVFSILDSFAKKEGLFRMHMMGKRVNQACRSVISPDYLVEPNEVLLPRPFARNLSFPEAISFYSPARAALMKQCIINGPHRYPGATHIEHRLANGEVRIISLTTRMDEAGRKQIAERIFAQAAQQRDTFIVYRHLLDHDRCVFNRQPTLHKPSMMGYRVRVLSGLKTLRFHYVNGKSYNADFDGDEMNVHIPQTLEARAELECLMDANLNFLVPTSGKPIRGLIQDHVAAGVLLTVRDKFFDRATFTQLIFESLAPYLAQNGAASDVSTLIPHPAVYKPVARWTGKQLISVIVKYVCGAFDTFHPKRGVSLRATSLIQPSAYQTTDLKTHKSVSFKKDDMSDDRVIFRDGELLCGVICKNQLGPSAMSVAHVIHEIHGAHAVGRLFGALGRILTKALQREGFSMGTDDMMLTSEKRRTDLLRRLDNAPLLLPDSEAAAMGKIMELSTALQKEYVPGRMLVPFPRNQLLMMTVSGAKGSNTNTIQMSLGLGQQLFDGQRVKRMNSGKTLPAFFVGEKRARSFGYAMGRFASGIRPPEYTIHAMAGRDGLIDTAVKTSRSGHLQRCLIKGLESLTVQWDHSVRDSNGSMIQFVYGGDGLDPCKASTLNSWEMVKDNLTELQRKFKCQAQPLPESVGKDGSSPSQRRSGRAAAVEELLNENGKRMSQEGMSQEEMDEEEEAQRVKQRVQAEVERDPLPQHLTASLRKYLTTKAAKEVQCFTRVSHLQRWVRQQNVAEKFASKRQEHVAYLQDACEEVSAKRRVRSYCDAGEPVGLLAAQAAGEPSTQMTLNTFHSAGSTVTHVTEGIPRLRELLIHASVQKGAVMIPVEKAGPQDEEAIRKILRVAVPIKLADCLAPMEHSRHMHIAVARNLAVTKTTAVLLFSETLLLDAANRMCMTTAEHAEAFNSALKAYVRSVINVLRGRSVSGGKAGDGGGAENGEGATRDAVTDPAMLMEEADDVASNSDNDMAPSDDESAAVPDRKKSSPVMQPSAAAAAETSDDEDDATIAARATLEHDSDDEEVAVAAPNAAPTVSHTSIPMTQSTYGGGRFSASIAVVPRSTSAALAALPQDFFAVEIILTMPSSIVAVIPDVLQGALTNVAFPTWVPQFGEVTFSRSSSDASSGEMWFHGKGATVRQAVNLVSYFNLNAPAIKTSKARSTDINDMALSLGIESGYQSLLDELVKLFKRYAVDPRHMTLVADAATHRGIWENYNFTGVIARSASPLFQMTFASAKRFLHSAVTRGVGDGLESISSAIMVGAKPKVGTATVQWFHDPTMLQDVFERTSSSSMR